MKLNINWYKNLIERLKPFADKDFQERVWLKGEGNEISSFIEATCQLFDDTALDYYLKNTNDIIVSEKCDEILHKLSCLVELIDEKLNTAKIINHQNMLKIRPLAKEAINLIEMHIKDK